MRVKLMWHTPNPEIAVALAMRRCYSSKPIEELERELLSKPGYEKELIAKAIRDKTFDVIEHAVFMFEIEGVSRIMTHQLVRHRIASYDQECFDEETEILTEGGWKRFPELVEGVRFATLNLASDSLEFQAATSRFVNYFDGEMIRIATSAIDCLVTPNHRMVIKTGKNSEWFVEKASEAAKRKSVILKKSASCWPALATELSIVIPGATMVKNIGGQAILVQQQDIPLNSKAMMEFAGFFISQGSTFEAKGKDASDGVRCVVSLRWSKRNATSVEEIDECLGKLPFTIERYDTGHEGVEWMITDESLFQYLSPLGGEKDKHIPSELLARPREDLMILFDALMQSCGHFDGTEYKYFTTSRRLAGGIQELCLKLGWSSDVSENGSGLYCARVNQNRKENEPMIRTGPKNGRKSEIAYQPYRGLVWCVTVPNSFLYIRRNGKPMWIGNSQRFSAVEREDFIVPHSIQSNPAALTIYEEQLKNSIEVFKKLKELEVPKEDARFVLPQSIGTKIVMTANARALMHFFYQRTALQAQWEIRELAELMYNECKKVAPTIFSQVVES